MKITIYSTTTCPYCKMVKDYLFLHDLSFEEKLVDQDEASREEMSSVSGGFMGVPFIVVEKDDGSIEKIVGFDKERLKNTLQIQE
jgi:glutaredoxin